MKGRKDPPISFGSPHPPTLVGKRTNQNKRLNVHESNGLNSIHATKSSIEIVHLPCSPQMEQTKKPRGSRPLEQRHHCLRDSAWNLQKGEKMMMQHMAGFQSLGAHFAGCILLKRSRDISQIRRKPLLVAAPEVLAANLTSLRRVQAQPNRVPTACKST